MTGNVDSFVAICMPCPNNPARGTRGSALHHRLVRPVIDQVTEPDADRGQDTGRVEKVVVTIPPGPLVREQVVLVCPQRWRQARAALAGRDSRRQLREEAQSTRLGLSGAEDVSSVARLTKAAIGDAPRDLTASSVASPCRCRAVAGQAAPRRARQGRRSLTVDLVTLGSKRNSTTSRWTTARSAARRLPRMRPVHTTSRRTAARPRPCGGRDDRVAFRFSR